ncbi:tRNA (guanine(9)-N1)-methyltransferase [Hypsizygus marmoreus]|uniref:tRNA (guanine(9)-N1)-methyltransferase n=1 Tax=Hypsizygus marmoreus TaxID=39966 RepID=A0A369JDA0_HYPMA|nr:tRNA (guanine(9)-N1)-methyltransferase [Hypsizygus marmoreus]
MDDTARPVEKEAGPSAIIEPASQLDVNPASEAPQDAAPQTLSKKAMKRAAKAELYAVKKLERRAKEKEAKKEKKRLIAEKRAAGELDEDEEEKNRPKKRPRIEFGGKVVVDLGFDEMMNEKEIISLCSQLAYTYSANRNAAYPFSLIYTSLNGRTFTRLEVMNDAGYTRWTNTEWWQEGYERLWLDGGEVSAPDDGPASHGGVEKETTPPVDQAIGSGKQPRQSVQQNVVYLTADSEEELSELKPEETYIIGGICDHNRYKNLCLNKAKESGVRTARLPIGRYLASLPTRKVLTVNQVFEILLKWVETRSWEEALYSVIPKRKFQGGAKGNTGPAPEEHQSGDLADVVDGEEAVHDSSTSPVVEDEQDKPVRVGAN